MVDLAVAERPAELCKSQSSVLPCRATDPAHDREPAIWGTILVVQGTYSQDWLLYDTDYNWRIEKAANGALRVDRRHRVALDGSGPTPHRLRR